MIANRKVIKAGLRRSYRSARVREVEHYGRLLQATLRELSPADRSDPCIALLTPGVYNSAFYEHMFLAGEIGAELVEGRDLVVNDGYVYMRTTAGLRRVDVIYRRVDDDFLDPLVFRPDSLLGVPGLLHAYRRGNVSLVNAPGTGIADDKSVYAYVPEMIRYYLGEDPILANVETISAADPKALNTRSTTWKPGGQARRESGGYGMLVGPHATPAERAAYANEVRANPADFIARPVLALSRAPCLIEVPLRTTACRPATVRAAWPADTYRPRRVLPRGPASGQLGGELKPGRRRQGSLGSRRLRDALVVEAASSETASAASPDCGLRVAHVAGSRVPAGEAIVSNILYQ